jgi:2-keto-4-pentenoate hydratase
LAEQLARSWLTGELIHCEIVISSAAQAYAVQAEVAQRLGWFKGDRPRVWKLGGSPGTGACAAAVPTDAVHESGWQAPVKVLGLEAELAVRLGRDLPAGSTLAQAAAAVEAWLPCIEVCATRFAGGVSDPLLQLADQQLNHALVLGPPVMLAEAVDWTTLGVSFEVDGQVLLHQCGGHPWGDPLSALPWLASHAARQADGLRAGDTIAMGSWTGLHPIQPGANVRVAFEGFGTA